MQENSSLGARLLEAAERGSHFGHGMQGAFRDRMGAGHRDRTALEALRCPPPALLSVFVVVVVWQVIV